MAKFAETSCSQCGRGFGPGDHGYSHCADHRAAAVIDAISELMAAHHLVWNHGGQLAGAVMVRDKAVKLLAEALGAASQ